MFSGKSHYGSCFLVFIHRKYVDTVISSTHHPFCIVLHLLPNSEASLYTDVVLFLFSFFLENIGVCEREATSQARRARASAEREKEK